MLISELTAKECRELVARAGFGRLACARNNQPYVVPVYFVYEPDHLYGFSTFGRKIEWLRANPKVCLEVDEIASHFSWASVIIHGRYQELPDNGEYASERLHAQMLLEKRTLWWQIAHATRQLQASREPFTPVLYSIHIDAMTGHRAVPDPVESAIGLLKQGAPKH